MTLSTFFDVFAMAGGKPFEREGTRYYWGGIEEFTEFNKTATINKLA
jgi:hypothetical protein